MRKIACLSDSDRLELFRNTAEKWDCMMPLSKKTFGSALLLIIYFTAVLGKILLPLKEEQAYRKPII